MKLSLAKWGNSLALRLPSALTQELGVREGSKIDAMMQRGRLVLEPVSKPKYRLEDLLAQITPANRHEEADWGGARGKEIW